MTAFVRRRDHRSEALADAGASIFVGDLIEPDDLRQAMRGVQRAYFASPWTPTQLHGAVNFAVAAQDAQLEVVVALTQWLAHPNHPSVATRQSYLTDRVFNGMAVVDTGTVNGDNLAGRETHAATHAFDTASAFNTGHIRVPSRDSGGLALRSGTRSVPDEDGKGEFRNVTIASTASLA